MKIEVIKAHSPRWGNHEQTAINMMATFSHLPGQDLPFTAHHDDVELHGRELFVRAKFGEYGEVAPYDGPTQIEMEQKAFAERKETELRRTESAIARLQRLDRLDVLTEAEATELEALERHSVEVMRTKHGRIPHFAFAS
ncbi:hypothetical protein [Aeromonas aquatica]|uniref:hypothetical protein n=1 Tax=Aeromonas aquatica TaxID=558964 RepID=UPI00051B77CF|nr:hypothetical protein [Aeromonas aquatica]